MLRKTMIQNMIFIKLTNQKNTPINNKENYQFNVTIFNTTNNCCIMSSLPPPRLLPNIIQEETTRIIRHTKSIGRKIEYDED